MQSGRGHLSNGSPPLHVRAVVSLEHCPGSRNRCRFPGGGLCDAPWGLLQTAGGAILSACLGQVPSGRAGSVPAKAPLTPRP